MLKFVGLIVCLSFSPKICAIPGATTIALKTVFRATTRRSVGVVAATQTILQNFKADIVIAYEESFGPRDPFMQQTPTPEDHAFEKTLEQRRLLFGLASKTGGR